MFGQRKGLYSQEAVSDYHSITVQENKSIFRDENATLSLLQDRFWRPNVARYVSHLPLPVPQRSWSHLGVDFATDLPPLEGNTCILVIVDRFSKSCSLIPLKGLSTATTTMELLFNHVFHPLSAFSPSFPFVSLYFSVHHILPNSLLSLMSDRQFCTPFS